MIEVNKGQQFQVQLSVMRSKDATTQQFLLAGCRDLAFNAVGKQRQYALGGFTFKDNVLTATVDTSEYATGVYSITARGRYLGEWWRAETVALFTVVTEGGVLPTETVAETANAVFSIREEFPSLMERVEKLETTPSGVTEEELAAVKKELNASISTNKSNIATNTANILTAKEAARKARIDGLLAYAHRIKARRDPWAEFLYYWSKTNITAVPEKYSKRCLGNALVRLIPIVESGNAMYYDYSSGYFDSQDMGDYSGYTSIMSQIDKQSLSGLYASVLQLNGSPSNISSSSSSATYPSGDIYDYVKRVIEICVLPMMVKTISMRGYDYDSDNIYLAPTSMDYRGVALPNAYAYLNPACFVECIDFGDNTFSHCGDPSYHRKGDDGDFYQWASWCWSAITALGNTASVMIAEKLAYRTQLVQYLKVAYPNTTWEDFDGILVRTSSDGYVDPKS